jgi:hypothetical protein
MIWRIPSAASYAACTQFDGGGAPICKPPVTEPTQCSSVPVLHNIFLTLQQYGVIFVDNGQTNTIVGTTDWRWPTDATTNNCLGALNGSMLEPVNIQPLLKPGTWPNSYQTTTIVPAIPPSLFKGKVARLGKVWIQ